MVGAPGLGQDNERILVDILRGYPPPRIRALVDAGVVADSPQ